MTSEQRTQIAGRLLEMIDELQTMQKHFDTRTTSCKCCGLGRASNFQERQAHEALGGAVSRIEKAVTLIGGAMDVAEKETAT